MLPRRVNPSDDAFFEDLAEQALGLTPNVESLAILRTLITTAVDPVHITDRERVKGLFQGVVQRWGRRIHLKHFQSDYTPLEDVLHILPNHSHLSHLSIRLTRQDLVRLESPAVATWSPAHLPLLSHLEADIQTIPLFVPHYRSITSVILHNMSICPCSLVLRRVGDALREANTVHTIHFTNLPTATVGHIVSIISPVPSLRTIIEKDKRWSDEPSRDEDWVQEMVEIIRQAPSLETYIVRTERVFAEDTCFASNGFTEMAEHLERHAPFFRFPYLCRVIFEIYRDDDGRFSSCSGTETLLIERNVDGQWCISQSAGHSTFS